MKRFYCLFFAVCLVACSSGGTKGDSQAMGEGGGKTLKFRKQSFIDKEGTGLEAYSVLVPEGWQFDAAMHWVLDQPAMPATSTFRIFNPKGSEEMEGFPNHCYFWTDNTMTLNMFPPGSRYFGSEVRQVTDALTCLKETVIPAARSNVPGFRIVSEESLPELASALTGGTNKQTTGAKVRVEYTKDGKSMEEEFFGITEPLTFPVRGMFGTTYNTIWYLEYLFSFKAEKGKLEPNSKLFQAIASSFRVNPKWYAKYSNFIEYLAQQQIQQIRSVGEFSRMLSQTSDQIREEQMQQFNERSAVYDKISEKFSDNILGIDRFNDPFEGREVELPSGYNHAWANNNGEYILVDDPNFNPNEKSNLHWELLERKK